MPLTREQIAARLRAAREAIGFTQAEVAERMGMHRPTLSEIEAGRRAVTSEELAQLARVYATSVAALLAETESVSDDLIAAVFRRQGVETPIGRLAVRRARAHCLAEQELEKLLGVSPASVLPLMRSAPIPLSKGEAIRQGEQLAADERRRLDLGAEPIRNPFDLLERQGVRTVQLEDDHGLDVDGIYFESVDTGACVAVNLRRDDHTGFRAVFTAAHEYGHWRMGDVTAEAFTLGPATDDPIETRANAFAAAFLMPEPGLREYLRRAGLLNTQGVVDHLSAADIVRAMDYFGVSRTALLYRLENIGLMQRDAAEELRNASLDLLKVAARLEIRFRPTRVAAGRLEVLAIEAWRRGLIGTGRAAELLRKDIAEFRETMAVSGEHQETEDHGLLGAAGG